LSTSTLGGGAAANRWRRKERERKDEEEKMEERMKKDRKKEKCGGGGSSRRSRSDIERPSWMTPPKEGAAHSRRGARSHGTSQRQLSLTRQMPTATTVGGPALLRRNEQNPPALV